MAQQDMQIAEILSDLVSLRSDLCDPTAALSLVSLRASPAPTPAPATPRSSDHANTKEEEDKDDADLQRVKDLVALHHGVRERCKTGELGRGLEGARRDVERALGG